MEENVKAPLMWSADGVTSQKVVNNEEERSLIQRDTEGYRGIQSTWGARLKQTTNLVMQVNTGTKNNRCL